MRRRHQVAAFGFVLTLTACTVAVESAPSDATVDPHPIESSTSSSSADSTTTTRPTTTTTAPETTTTTALTAETLEDGYTLSARSDDPLDVFESPDAADPWTTLTATTTLGTVRVVTVLEGPSDGWLRVSLPIRPNGSEGWIREDDVTLFIVSRRVDVDLSDRRLTVSDPDGVILETSVAVGGSRSPTPTGSFFITDSVQVLDPSGPWGPHAFGLSAHSDTITEFNGGDGIIGIHGTNQPASIGHAQSLGCVRVPNEVALQLAGLLSAGMPVVIGD